MTQPNWLGLWPHYSLYDRQFSALNLFGFGSGVRSKINSDNMCCNSFSWINSNNVHMLLPFILKICIIKADYKTLLQGDGSSGY